MRRKFYAALLAFLSFFLLFDTAQVRADSKAAAFVEMNTGRVLYQQNAHQRLPMASTTKIMTALVALENGDLESLVKVSETAQGVEGSSMYLKEGDVLTLNDLIIGLMFFSANDGAVAIAEHVSGSVEGFIELMNKQALDLNCVNTKFHNPNGLPDDEHYTTAYDLAIIAAYALKNEKFREIVNSAKAEITLNGNEMTIYNKNKFLNLYDYAIGIKTGYTKAAGRCFVSAAQKNGMVICGVLLNSGDIFGESEAILEQCYKKYSMETVLTKGQYLCSIPVSGGEETTFEVQVPEDIAVPLTDTEKESIEIKSDFIESLNAPVHYQRQIGNIQILLDGKVIAEKIIYTEYTIGEKIPLVDRFKEKYKIIIDEIF